MVTKCHEKDSGVPAGGVASEAEPDLWPLRLILQSLRRELVRHDPQSAEEGEAGDELRYARSAGIHQPGSDTPAQWTMSCITSQCALKNASTLIGQTTQQLQGHHRLFGVSDLSLWKPRVRWRGTKQVQVRLIATTRRTPTRAHQNPMAARWWRNQKAHLSLLRWRSLQILTPKLAAWTFGMVWFSYDQFVSRSHGSGQCQNYESVLSMSISISESVMLNSVLAFYISVCNVYV